jgi:hypothetical protein
MTASAFRPYALCWVGAAMFTGCGGHNSSGAVPATDTPSSVSGHRVFKYTGAAQTFKVPYNVTEIKVIALGGNGSSQYGERFGFGARVSAVIPVTPGEQLKIFVGGNASKASGGFNGGAVGGTDGCCAGGGGGGGGGGATDVRAGAATLGDRILVAGGGGGQGGQGEGAGGRGGRGGTPIGRPGGQREGSYYVCNGAGGLGGTETAGGAGGAGSDCGYTGGVSGANGTLGTGGAGGDGGSKGVGDDAGAGGAGGGGYYGGGGGGGGADSRGAFGDGGGGAGGSSYVESSATKVRFWASWRKPHVGGSVVFDW